MGAGGVLVQKKKACVGVRHSFRHRVERHG